MNEGVLQELICVLCITNLISLSHYGLWVIVDEFGVRGIACEEFHKFRAIVATEQPAVLRTRTSSVKFAITLYIHGVELCFECSEFSCETIKQGPIR